MSVSLDVQESCGEFPAPCCHVTSPDGIAQGGEDCRRELIGAARRDEPPGLPLNHYVRKAANSGRYGRDAK
ncbi:MAG TPA: hypothetical protein VJY33_03080 [Isosphaeraceae bacterium]|nr:hypothetical protein [Isosphaeraceae bacterium]